MERHPRAQKAYAPCASIPGIAATPPSYVWPVNSRTSESVTEQVYSGLRVLTSAYPLSETTEQVFVAGVVCRRVG